MTMCENMGLLAHMVPCAHGLMLPAGQQGLFFFALAGGEDIRAGLPDTA